MIYPKTLVPWNWVMEWKISDMNFPGDTPREISNSKTIWINLSDTYKHNLKLDGVAEAIPMAEVDRQWAPPPPGPLAVIQQWEILGKDKSFIFSETQWGPNHAFPNELGKSLEIMAKMLWANGRYAEAEALFIRLLERNQRLWPNGKDGNPDAICVWPSGSQKPLRTRINEAFKKQKITSNVFGLSGTYQKASKNSTNQECPRRIQVRAKESPR